MYITGRVFGVQSDQLHQAQDLVPAVLAVGAELMDIQRLTDDLFDRHTGIQ